jgi:hypothetical protein
LDRDIIDDAGLGAVRAVPAADPRACMSPGDRQPAHSGTDLLDRPHRLALARPGRALRQMEHGLAQVRAMAGRRDLRGCPRGPGGKRCRRPHDPDDRQHRNSVARQRMFACARGGAPAWGRGQKRGSHLNALGRSRDGVSTKIHVLTEANGLPLAIHLTPGQAADISAAPELLAPGQTRPRELLADKGCRRRRPARGAVSARRAPHYSVEVEPQSAWLAGPSPLCPAQLHRAHDGFAEAVSPRRDALRQDRRKLPQLRPTRRNPEVDALCPHGLAAEGGVGLIKRITHATI